MKSMAMAFVLGLLPAIMFAEQPGRPEGRWLFATRMVLSGTSHDSDPEGITIYSGLSLEGAVRRDLGRRFAAELSLRTESREVDRDTWIYGIEPLGSLEVLPVTLIFQYRPKVERQFHPYVGAGANMTVVWEKSGSLDTYDVEPHVGPAIQLGFDIVRESSAVLNFDIHWNAYTANIVHDGDDFAQVKIDPLTLGFGGGFRF